jgi:hypothetical protein
MEREEFRHSRSILARVGSAEIHVLRDIALDRLASAHAY